MHDPKNQVLSSKKGSYIFELSGEHETLPTAEIVASLEALDFNFEIHEEDFGVLVVSAPKMDLGILKNKLALSHLIDSHIFSDEVNNIENIDFPINIQDGSFAVRAKRIQNFFEDVNLKELEKKVADCVDGNNEVNLRNPKYEIRVIISKRAHIGLVKAKIPRSSFEERKVQNRPYFSPVSLHPRLARALVNLSRVKIGERLHDPFCGTGGVLMEASLIGAKATGSDIDSKMVSGCLENLNKFKIDDVEIFQSDIGEIPDMIPKVDAIATDPPYGKSATTNREGMNSLYKRAFTSFSQVLKNGGYLSMVLPDENLVELGKKYLKFKECHPYRVHRSLTRNFCVYQKEIDH
jgi:tRNA (guanine10-N2)-dimethyltransferase